VALVLIVEDNADLREMYEEILAMAGHGALLAESGQEALELLASARPAVILLDLGVEGGGEGLLATIRARPELEGMAVILASGARDLAEWAEKLGAAAYLQKPFMHDALIEAVQRVCPK
jgi:DNA-binding NtrC family response regulator